MNVTLRMQCAEDCEDNALLLEREVPVGVLAACKTRGHNSGAVHQVRPGHLRILR